MENHIHAFKYRFRDFKSAPLREEWDSGDEVDDQKG
jgi:hypothetical protein